NFLDVRARSHSFDGVAQYSGDLTTVTGVVEPGRASIYTVSPDFFNVLAVRPLLGRTFSPEESKSGGAPVAVVSYGFWQRLLGARSDLTGTSLRVMDQSVNVIGVMPPDFAFPRTAEIWIPRELFPGEISRSAHNWSVVARMRSNITAEQAYADVSALQKQLKQEFGKDMDAVDFVVVPQQEYMVGNV